MAIYYIDPSASTNGDGSLLSPFNTWASVVWAAGNTYLQRAGTTQAGYRVLITAGGSSAANRVIVGSYDPVTGLRTTGGNKRAILNGAGTPQTMRVNQGVNWVWIDNIEIYGTDGTGGSRAVAVYFGNGPVAPCHDIEVSNLYVHDVRSEGFADNADCNAIQGFGNRATIRNCVIERIPADGIWLQGSDYKIIDNRISEVSTRSIYGDNIQINGDADLRNDRGYIARNWLDHSNKNSKQVIICGGIGFSSNAVIEDNYCVMAPLDVLNINTSCIFVEAENSIVRRNYCQGGFFGVMASSSGTGVTVHSNLCVGNHRGVSTDTTGARAINNTVIGSIQYGFFSDNDTTAVCRNNVFLNCAVAVAMETGVGESNNCYYGNATNRALLGGASAWGTSIFADPLLSSTYRPLPGSPLIGTGEFLGNLQDKNSTTYQNPPSIGAYEYIRPRTAASTRTMRT